MNTTSDLISYFDDAMASVAPEFRVALRDYVVRRSSASDLPLTREALDALIAEGRRYLGIDGVG